MIKRTLCFSSPAYLSLKLRQMVYRSPEDESAPRTIPVEDIGIVILDNQQITITQGLMSALLENNCAIVSCDGKHLPTGLFLPLSAHTLQNERFRRQLDASLPLKKQLWQQTIEAKIYNQAVMLELSTKERHNNMYIWSEQVKSGDSDNMEARAAAYYWKALFPDNPSFIRGQEEGGANVLLNYGYAILRATVARALVGNGMLPTLGIHHHNRYDAYCLADDVMEPYRPYVDKLVFEMLHDGILEINKDAKLRLLTLPTTEVTIEGQRRPLMVAVSQTSASLAKCFNGEIRKIVYPEMIIDGSI